jgi:hypothetical protein
MNKNNEFDNILEKCLERLLEKGDKIADCLASYPEHADSLKPLLEMATTTREAISIQPRPEFKAKARYQFHTALQQAASRKKRFLFPLRFRWATVATAALILILASGSMVAASSNSMPDEPLYHIKLAVEQFQLKLTPSALDKAKLYARLSDRRVMEIVRMAQKGNPRLIEVVTQRLDNQLIMLASLAITRQIETGSAEKALSPAAPEADTSEGQTSFSQGVNDDQLLSLLRQYAASNPETLRNLLSSVPEEVRPALLEAIAVTSAGYERAISAISN